MPNSVLLLDRIGSRMEPTLDVLAMGVAVLSMAEDASRLVSNPPDGSKLGLGGRDEDAAGPALEVLPRELVLLG